MNTRRWALAGLTLLVTALHLQLAGRLLEPRLGEGAAQRTPRRIEISFVRELAPAAPPAPAPARAAPRPRRAAPAVAPASETQAEAAAAALALAAAAEAASAAAQATAMAQAAAEAAAAAASAASAAATAAATAVAIAEAASAASAAAVGSAVAETSAATTTASAAAFEWPPSTRLNYVLTGHYRGPVDGRAQVEWLRSGSRYQVIFELAIGPPFATLVSRRISSEGEITATGLYPRRYDEETRVALREPRRLRIELGLERVRLPSGQELPRPEGLQDSASQFVQMTWLFTQQPALLQPGRQVHIPLALPRHVQRWTYDVIGNEILYTPMGALETVHVKPRREAQAGTDLTAELWIAPSLQYLPVRIVVRQDAGNHVDLLLERLPLQEAAASAPR